MIHDFHLLYFGRGGPSAVDCNWRRYVCVARLYKPLSLLKLSYNNSLLAKEKKKKKKRKRQLATSGSDKLIALSFPVKLVAEKGANFQTRACVLV